MSENIMYLGREVVKVIGGDCRLCVGSVNNNDDGKPGCSELPDCLGSHFEYANIKPPLDVFIDQAAKNYFYFGGNLHNVDFSGGRYSSRRAAIRGAKRFCAKIGFECRIKENK